MAEILAGIFILLGSAFVFIAALGLIRLDDVFMRMHAATKAGTLGVGFMLIAVAIFFGLLSVTVKSISVIIFFMLTAPIGAHMLGRASYMSGVSLSSETGLDELRGKYDTRSHDLKSSPPPPAKKKQAKS